MSTHLNISNWEHELINAVPDPKVGISLSYLAGNEQFTTYAIEFKPGSHVAAHYHPEGIEIYQILSGKGVMKTGSVNADHTIKWDQTAEVQRGDFFTVDAGVVHTLENNSSERLILIVTCSPSHLGHNRVVIE
jgi:mannose-6-phosphate isomerase-like protein (cupin superfamily)